MKKITAIATIFLFSSVLLAKGGKQITLEKIWLQGTFSPKYVQGLNSMEDGIHYSVLENGEDGQEINQYAYKSGNKTSNILKNTFKTDDGNPMNIEGYEFSSDERKILIQTESERIYRHSMRSEYYMYDIDSKKLKRIGEGKFQLASFSPNGSYVSYVRENNLYIYDIANNKERAVTTDGLKNSIINGAPDWVYEEEFALVKGYDWSKDSKCLAYYRFDESNVKEFSFPMYGSLYPTNYVYKYPKAGEENARIAVMIYHLESNKVISVKTSEEFEYIPRMNWLESNDMLAVQFMNREQSIVRLEMADRNTGISSSMLREESETYLEVQDVYFYKKKNAFLWTSEKTGYNHIFYYEYDPIVTEDGSFGVKDKKQITEGDIVVTEIIGVDEEKNILFYQFTDKYNPTDRLTMRMSLDDDPEHPPQPMPLPGGFTSMEPSKGFQYFVSFNTTMRTPLLVNVHDNEGHPVRMIEDNKTLMDTLKSYNLSPKQLFKFKNRNDDELIGWIIKPANFDPNKKYPVLMYVYGGPGSQTVTNSWGGSNDMWFQYLAQKGYIIASVDNRGTGARTREFRTCTYGQLGKLETEDQIDAANYFAHLSYIDEKRIGIWGWSYGGYMSTLCLAKGNDVFKMAIAVAPVTNWRFYDSIYTERYMGLPKKNGASYDENSPINHVDKIKGPYLLVHGTADDNVHFQNTTELISALVDKDVQFDLAIYPNKNHGIYGGNTRYHLYTKMSDFIFTNL